jgi:hypothetical protein
VRAFAADPGLVNTEIGLKSNSFIARWAWGIRRRGGISADESAKGIVYLATAPELQEAQEIYWKHSKPKSPSKYALDPEAAAALWNLPHAPTRLIGQNMTEKTATRQLILEP